MHKYLPHSEVELQSMLKTIGVNSINDLFADVPSSVLETSPIKIGHALSEVDLMKYFDALASKNKKEICLLGGGVYDHYVPSVISSLTSRQEFLTSYTPYQPEISQGTLQYIFEYQSMITELTGLDVANASLYDGATALVEAVFMAEAITRKNKVAVPSSISPRIKDVLKTYLKFRNIEIVEFNVNKGRLDIEEFKKINDGSLSCVIATNPNYYGLLEDASELFSLIHEQKGIAIAYVNPLILGLVKSPKEMGADIAVGEAQSLGIPLSFGGPYLGFIATSKEHMRKLPGRIVGVSTDSDNHRAYVLTLQAREQHIRREKATSNICSNQSLMALWVTIYLSLLGEEGLRSVALINMKNSHYAYNEILKLGKYKAAYDDEFFNEFVLETSIPLSKIDEALISKGYTSGIHLGENKIMFAITEKRNKKEIDEFVKILGGL